MKLCIRVQLKGALCGKTQMEKMRESKVNEKEEITRINWQIILIEIVDKGKDIHTFRNSEATVDKSWTLTTTSNKITKCVMVVLFFFLSLQI